MNVRDIMHTERIAVSPDAKVAEVARAMLDNNISGVPVIDEEGRILGIVTETDMVAKQARVHLPIYIGLLGSILPFESRRNEEEITHALAVNAGELMEHDAATIDADASIEDVATLMIDNGADPIPVLEGGTYVGIVSRRDLVRLIAVEEEDAG